jgi:serine/threonine protein kinase
VQIYYPNAPPNPNTPNAHASSRHTKHLRFLSMQLSLMVDIARGIKYLHEHKPPVIHRDCKSSNILITSKVTAKIADFGLAKVKQSTRSMVRSLVGTVNWQAPELWHAHPKYDYKVDVYSCACVFWEMMQWHLTSKKYPWEVSVLHTTLGG